MAKEVPSYLPNFGKAEQAKFLSWMAARGGVELGRTNEYEVLRLTARDGIAIVYTNQAGRLRWTPAAIAAWRAYAANVPFDEYRVVEKGKRIKGGTKRRQMIAALVIRDGDTCACCGLRMPEEDMTIEHLVPVAAGGESKAHNLIVVHEECNQRLSNHNIREKLEIIMLARVNASAQQCHADHQRNTETERDDKRQDGRVATRPLASAGA